VIFIERSHRIFPILNQMKQKGREIMEPTRHSGHYRERSDFSFDLVDDDNIDELLHGPEDDAFRESEVSTTSHATRPLSATSDKVRNILPFGKRVAATAPTTMREKEEVAGDNRSMSSRVFGTLSRKGSAASMLSLASAASMPFTEISAVRTEVSATPSRASLVNKIKEKVLFSSNLAQKVHLLATELVKIDRDPHRSFNVKIADKVDRCLKKLLAKVMMSGEVLSQEESAAFRLLFRALFNVPYTDSVEKTEEMNLRKNCVGRVLEVLKNMPLEKAIHLVDGRMIMALQSKDWSTVFGVESETFFLLQYPVFKAYLTYATVRTASYDSLSAYIGMSLLEKEVDGEALAAKLARVHFDWSNEQASDLFYNIAQAQSRSLFEKLAEDYDESLFSQCQNEFLQATGNMKYDLYSDKKLVLTQNARAELIRACQGKENDAFDRFYRIVLTKVSRQLKQGTTSSAAFGEKDFITKEFNAFFGLSRESHAGEEKVSV
jgi:hypothetical protein